MVRSFIILILTFAAFTCVAQDDFDENKMVGFACFYEGRETKVVAKFKKMLQRKKYAAISEALQSKNSAERLMAVICLEGLDTASVRSINANEKILVEEIKASVETVDMCSGCFPIPGVKLQDVFTSQILWLATPWLQRHLKD